MHSDLIERLERAEGPDRKLDAELDAYLFGGVASHTLEGDAFKTHRSYRKGTVFSPARFGVVLWRDTRTASLYTASLDAALALVDRRLPNAHVCLVDDPTYRQTEDQHALISVEYLCHLKIWHSGRRASGPHEQRTGKGRTRPIALLRALSTTPAKEAEQ